MGIASPALVRIMLEALSCQICSKRNFRMEKRRLYLAGTWPRGSDSTIYIGIIGAECRQGETPEQRAERKRAKREKKERKRGKSDMPTPSGASSPTDTVNASVQQSIL